MLRWLLIFRQDLTVHLDRLDIHCCNFVTTIRKLPIAGCLLVYHNMDGLAVFQFDLCCQCVFVENKGYGFDPVKRDGNICITHLAGKIDLAVKAEILNTSSQIRKIYDGCRIVRLGFRNVHRARVSKAPHSNNEQVEYHRQTNKTYSSHAKTLPASVNREILNLNIILHTRRYEQIILIRHMELALH